MSLTGAAHSFLFLEHNSMLIQQVSSTSVEYGSGADSSCFGFDTNTFKLKKEKSKL